MTESFLTVSGATVFTKVCNNLCFENCYVQ